MSHNRSDASATSWTRKVSMRPERWASHTAGRVERILRIWLSRTCTVRAG